MSFISGVEDPCISAWSPKSVLPNYLLTGSYEGVYSTGHERNVFDLYSLQNDELNKVTFSYKYKYQIITLFIRRLNSGIFRIFDPREWNLNLNSSDCRASKIIWNVTKLGPISWELNIEYPIFNFCVGVWVGEHHRANFSHKPKDAQ